MRSGMRSVPVVEFLGVPGSGTSTLARELVGAIDGVSLEEAVRETVAVDGEDPVTRAVARMTRTAESRAWRTAYGRSSQPMTALTRFLAGRPETLESVLAAQRLRADRDRGQESVLGWILNLMARYELAVSSMGSRWLVIDEGFAQRSVALFAYGFEQTDVSVLADYLVAAPLPDALVVVEIPLETASRRLDERGWSERITDLDSTARRRFLEDSARVVEVVANHLEGTPTRLIWVDGTTPVPDSLTRGAATLLA